MAVCASHMALIANERPNVNLTFQAQTGDTTDASTYTFAGQAIGAAAANRYVIVGVSTTTAISSVTVGGVTATQLVQNSGTSAIVGIFIALVPTGTTASIVVNTGASFRCVIAVWSALNTTSSSPSTNSSTVSPEVAAVTVPPGGAVVAVAYDSNTGSFTWTNLTKQADAQVETQTFSCASDVLPTVNASRTITATGPAGSGHTMAVATLQTG